jgi:hypothetical protein
MRQEAFSAGQETAAQGAPTNCFTDISGDLNDDNLNNSTDTFIRKAICYARSQGWVQGVTPLHFAPHQDVDRDQVASFYARFLDVDGFGFQQDQYDDTSPFSVHACNIARISDLDADATYGNGAFVIQGFPPVPSDYGPDLGINNAQAHTMGERAGDISDDNISDDLDDTYPCGRRLAVLS